MRGKGEKTDFKFMLPSHPAFGLLPPRDEGLNYKNIPPIELL